MFKCIEIILKQEKRYSKFLKVGFILPDKGIQ